ncbi:MAG: hypothetical protein WCA24_13000, partial [Thiomonas sp.]
RLRRHFGVKYPQFTGATACDLRRLVYCSTYLLAKVETAGRNSPRAGAVRARRSLYGLLAQQMLTDRTDPDVWLIQNIWGVSKFNRT